MHNLEINSTKNRAILHLFHITNCITLKICRQKLNKKLSNIVSIIVKVLISKLSFLHSDLEIYFVKESVSKYLRSFVVCRFICPGSSPSYISESTRYVTKRIKKHWQTFEIMDSATSSYRLKLKEMCIVWKEASLNKQVNHVSISITI